MVRRDYNGRVQEVDLPGNTSHSRQRSLSTCSRSTTYDHAICDPLRSKNIVRGSRLQHTQPSTPPSMQVSLVAEPESATKTAVSARWALTTTDFDWNNYERYRATSLTVYDHIFTSHSYTTSDSPSPSWEPVYDIGCGPGTTSSPPHAPRRS
jgi:hypothetical protein